MKKIIKIAATSILIIAILMTGLSLIISLPSAQLWITNHATQYLQTKYGISSSIQGINISFPRNVIMDELLVHDQDGDTLIYIEKIDLNANYLDILRNKISWSNLRIKGLKGHIYRNKADSTFNFSAILNAFQPKDSVIDSAARKEWQFAPGKIRFADWNVKFEDPISGFDYRLDLGDLEIMIKRIDPGSGLIEIGRFALRSTKASVKNQYSHQTEATPATPNSLNTESPVKQSGSWTVVLNTTTLDDLSFELEIEKSMSLLSTLGLATIENIRFDLTPLSVAVERVNIDRSFTDLRLLPPSAAGIPTSSDTSVTYIAQPAEGHPFGSSPIHVSVTELALNNSNVHLDLDTLPRIPDAMDYRHYDLMDIQLSASDFLYNPDTIHAVCQSVSASEASGLTLLDMQGIFSLDPESITARDIRIKTGKSTIEGLAGIRFANLRAIGDQLENLELFAELGRSVISMDEIEKIYPMDLGIKRGNLLMVDTLGVEGKISDIFIRSLLLSAGKNTALDSRGRISGLLMKGPLNIQMEMDTFHTTASDIGIIFLDTILNTGIPIPEQLGLKTLVSGRSDSLALVGAISSSFGTLWDTLLYQYSQDRHTISGVLRTSQFRLDSLLRSDALGEISMSASFSTDFEASKLVSASLDAQIENIDYGPSTFNNLTIDGTYANEQGNAAVRVDNAYLNASLTGLFQLRETDFNIQGNLLVADLNFDSLGLSDKDMKLSTDTDYTIKYDSTGALEAAVRASAITVTKQGAPFDLHPVKIDISESEKGVKMKLLSDAMDVYLIGNTTVAEIPDILKRHIRRYLGPDESTIDPDKYFGFGIDLHRPELITELLYEKIKVLDLKRFRGKYEAASNDLELEIMAPKFQYGEIVLDNMQLLVQSDSNSFMGNFRIEKIGMDTIFLNPINLKTNYNGQKLSGILSVEDTTGNIRYFVESSLTRSDNGLIFKIGKEKLVINQNDWEVDPRNQLTILGDSMKSEFFRFSHGDEIMEVTSDYGHMKADIQRFNLENIQGFFTQAIFRNQINGFINGKIESIIVDSSKVRNLALSLDELKILNNPLGSISIDAHQDADSILSYSVSLDQERNKIRITGDKDSKKDLHKIDVHSELHDLAALAFLFPEYLRHPSGNIISNVLVRMENDAREITGKISFRNASVLIQPVNLQLTIPDEEIVFSENGITVKDFTVLDSVGNQLEFNGNITTTNYKDYVLNVTAMSDRFSWLSKPASKEATFFGNLYSGLDLKLNGTSRKPKVEVRISILDGTNATYVMPGKDLDIVSDEGIVFFSDKLAQIDTIDHEEVSFIADSLAKKIGMDLEVRLNIDEAAQFTVVTDPNSGDFTTFHLDGKLLYRYSPTAPGKLNGLVEFRKTGFYELSFYGLVKKKFEFQPGSTVTWSNRVMDGDVNFRAKYTVNTNSAGLVSGEISDYETARYNQRLPYDVVLNITGPISDPSIHFNLDLAQRYKSDYPLIASKLQSLNQEDREAERNKQVFALLVAGTFIPEASSSSGSSSNTFATTAAANSINAIFTQQLNNLTGQLIKGIDVNFGMNTFEDYSTGGSNKRTQLDVQISKNLFNDRVSFEVENHIDLEGSNPQVGQKKTAGTTEFAVYYKITENGNYRVKAFRENAFDFYDGEIQNSGVAFIVMKEFNMKQRKQYFPKGNQ